MGEKTSKIRLWAVIFWLAVWQLAAMGLARAYPHGSLLLASPAAVLYRLGQLAVTAAFWQTVGWSAARIFGGFLLSTLLAVLLAALAAWKNGVGELLAPLVAVIKAVPVASFIVIALLWLSSRRISAFIAFLMVLPVLYANALQGIREADPQLLEMARVFHVPFRRTLGGIWLPQVLPYFRAAVSLALGLCWKAGAAAEVIGLPSGTIGERLYTAKVYFQTPDLFAWTAVIVAVSVLFEKLFLALVDALAGKAGL